jgi:NADPH:quinone reductase-like Zn-dependent oxidoreductase
MAHRALQLLANEPTRFVNESQSAASQRRIVDMKAIFIRSFGGPEVLEYGEFADAVVGAGDVLVKVAAAGINPIDIMERSGLTKEFKPVSFPGVLGWDLSGTVIAVGPDVVGFSIGDKVLAWAYHTYAELCVVNAELLAKVPDGLDLVEAAALPLVTTTGNQLVSVAGEIKRGQTALVAGAFGGVGRSAVFTAKELGARVIAGVLKKQCDAARTLGADQVVALDDEDALNALAAVDAVANTVRGKTAEQLLGKVKPGGIFASVTGAPANANDYPSVRVVSYVSHQDAKTVLAMAQAVSSGELVMPIERKLPLSAAREGHEAVGRGGTGKVLLLP